MVLHQVTLDGWLLLRIGLLAWALTHTKDRIQRTEKQDRLILVQVDSDMTFPVVVYYEWLALALQPLKEPPATSNEQDQNDDGLDIKLHLYSL